MVGLVVAVCARFQALLNGLFDLVAQRLEVLRELLELHVWNNFVILPAAAEERHPRLASLAPGMEHALPCQEPVVRRHGPLVGGRE